MRYRIIIADFDRDRIALLGHTRIIELFRDVETAPTLERVEDWLMRAGAVPEGYRVAMVKEVRL